MNTLPADLPPVATWRINAMRLLFLLMACFMGGFVWYRLLFRGHRPAAAMGPCQIDAGGTRADELAWRTLSAPDAAIDAL
ncbi:MAG: hypothetical protein R3E03_02440 [Novosphingobium sp.]